MKIKLDMLESDIIRSMKSNRYSPVQLCVARYFNEHPSNIEYDYDSIIIWNDDINDYDSYKYCAENIQDIKDFLDEWNDYSDNNVNDFCATVISFCIEPKR